MQTNRLTKEEIFKWCSIPKEELKNQPNLKTKLEIRKDKATVMTELGNMMADEVIKHNNQGIPTKWVLPAGPTDEYAIFVERVNKERISLKNLWIFHMDEFLDWEGRPLPVADTYESLEGTMNACFYGRIDDELNVPEEQRIWPRINNIDYADEMCEKLGGVDTVWAGIGATGLVAFNEAPRNYCYRLTVDEYAKGKTRIVELNDDSMLAMSQRSFGCCLDRIPPKAITIGFRIMLSAKRCIYMVATGTWKQTVCRIILFSEPTTEYPVTIIPAYVPDVTLMTTEDTIDHPLAHEMKGW
ncbi:glucosamine-6-phosphate isomerase [Lachnotalea glycerini]|uniref:Glucosamine-6-phosphate isomerase n=1 Tax=Lachnotalea glycerini TaxID=1763509 RepID=A0A371JKJ9_9FIRM|nr:glucosamine-6-phosphate isomerase [Lachnotalea glycerini]RDY33253.1 glucosamine-6-phosphate isomerase [Lachnotalea glycerini]